MKALSIFRVDVVIGHGEPSRSMDFVASGGAAIPPVLVVGGDEATTTSVLHQTHKDCGVFSIVHQATA
jgi:hypothetical protein